MTEERTQLVAPCGLDCGVCELHRCRDHEDLKAALVSKGIPKEALPCDGCRAIHGKCPAIADVCATFTCANEHRVEFCSECVDFPCAKLLPAADKAGVLPHNLKLFNLCIIARKGAAAVCETSVETKVTYYRGTLGIGNGPTLDTPGRQHDGADAGKHEEAPS